MPDIHQSLEDRMDAWRTRIHEFRMNTAKTTMYVSRKEFDDVNTLVQQWHSTMSNKPITGIVDSLFGVNLRVGCCERDTNGDENCPFHAGIAEAGAFIAMPAGTRIDVGTKVWLGDDGKVRPQIGTGKVFGTAITSARAGDPVTIRINFSFPMPAMCVHGRNANFPCPQCIDERSMNASIGGALSDEQLAEMLGEATNAESTSTAEQMKCPIHDTNLCGCRVKGARPKQRRVRATQEERGE